MDPPAIQAVSLRKRFGRRFAVLTSRFLPAPGFLWVHEPKTLGCGQFLLRRHLLGAIALELAGCHEGQR